MINANFEITSIANTHLSFAVFFERIVYVRGQKAIVVHG